MAAPLVSDGSAAPVAADHMAGIGQSTCKSSTSWKQEVYGMWGMHVESGAPLRIGLFFAVVNVLLRLLVMYFGYYLITADWLYRGCVGDVAVEDCDPACMLLSINNTRVDCTAMSTISQSVFAVCACLLVFDVYILLRVPITNTKRLKWMQRRYKLSLAFLLCEAACAVLFLFLLLVSLFISMNFKANDVQSVPPFSHGLRYNIAIACLSMLNVFIYMFVDWCSVCDLPPFKVASKSQ
eukprot:scpid80050/ scgid13614/ 